MTIYRRLAGGTGGIAMAILLSNAVLSQAHGPEGLAGLISELSGTASIRRAGAAETVRARRFDAIGSGATLEVGAESRALIVLAGGQRFVLGAHARATIKEDRVTSTSGPVEELAAVPPLPRIAALDDSRPKGPAGGVRLRNPTISGLSPFSGTTLPGRTVLRFTAVAGASKYGVDIEDESGARVFQTETMTLEISVPEGVLRPETSYYWTVRTLDKFGAAAQGTGEFRTLSAKEESEREALRQRLEADGTGAALALMAEVDRRLGLYGESLAGFRAALSRTPDDGAVSEALRQLEQQLKQPGGR